MKIGVLKLGARISFSSQGTSGGTGEALSIIRMLKRGGADVTIFTKILSKDYLDPDYQWVDLSKPFQILLPNIDALVVINGTVQFYGGAEDPEQLMNYAIINSFPGKIFYLLCDPELTLKQIWPSVSKKEWRTNWDKDVLHIGRTDITYISQPYDVEKVLADLKKNEVKPRNIVHFPFERFPCLNERLPFNSNPTVDLSYGGTMRGGKRMKKMIKFYFGMPEEISVEMFGKIKIDDFKSDQIIGLKPPHFTGPIRYDEMLPKMNESMSHVVIGDPWYEQINDIPQRLYESIQSSVVTFVDEDMDKMRRVYGSDKNLADFLYVSDRNEIAEKIMLLKRDPHARKQILEAQIDAIRFDANEYCMSFVNQIKMLC